MTWLDLAGWLGALFTLSAYSMRSMKPLRIVGLCANLSFITYGALVPVYPMLILHLTLLPLNGYRLVEIVLATRRLREARAEDHPLAALKPFLKGAHYPDGTYLFRRGETADGIYYVESGEVLLPEPGVSLGAGSLFGEMAYFSDSGTRTASAMCRGDCRILKMDDDKVMQLFGQNPEFAFYVVRLMARRLVAGSQERAGLYEDFAGN